MRLKLVFVLLCLVALILAYNPQKSDKPKPKKQEVEKKDGEGLDTKDIGEIAPNDEEEYDEDEEEEEEKPAPKKKNPAKRKPTKDSKREKNDKKDQKVDKTKIKKKDDSIFMSDSDPTVNMTSFDFLAIAREHRIDKLREIINDTQPDDLEKLREITESVKADDDYEEENEYQACNGDTAGDNELCHCEQDEIDCSEVVMDNDEPYLSTMDLVIQDKDFKPIIANFSSNRISRLQRNRVLPGFEKHVNVLDISYNKVRFVDNDVFKPFTNLTKLDLSHNNLQNVTKRFLDTVGDTLHRLDLGYNKIKALPDNYFDKLKNLKKLSLDGNPIKVWKKEMFAGLDNLETLSLDSCNIEDLPADIFENLPKLTGLSLRGNPMEEIPSVVAKLKTLKDVDMSSTSLTEIRDHAFAGDSDLEEIILENMKYLSAVRDCGFCGLPKLKTLLLNDNAALVEIHENAFGFIKSEPGHKAADITELDVHNSNLTMISEHMMDYDKIDSFKISGNPWNCNCDITFLMDEKFTFKQDSASPKCTFPQELKDKHLATVRAADACEKARFLGRSGRFSSVLGLALLVGFIAIGLVYLHSSGKLYKIVRQVRKEPEVSYTNLQSNGEDFALESDFQPRPAEV